MAILDKLDLSDRKTQLLLGGGAIVGVFALRGILGGGTAEVTTDVSKGYGTRSDGDGVPGWVGNANPTTPAPTPTKPDDGGQTTPRPTPTPGGTSPTTPRPTAGAPVATSSPAPKPTATKGQAFYAGTEANLQDRIMSDVETRKGMRGDTEAQAQQMGENAAAAVAAVSGGRDVKQQSAAERLGVSPQLQGASAPAAMDVKPKPKPRAVDVSKAAPKQASATPAPAKPKSSVTNVSAGARGRSLAAAGEGIVIDDDNDVNPHEWGWLAGTVGGFDPNPAAVTASVVAEIRGGESLASLSARLFGTSGHGSKLVAMNPDLLAGDGLTAGDKLRVM